MNIRDISGNWEVYLDDSKTGKLPEKYEYVISLPNSTSNAQLGKMNDEKKKIDETRQSIGEVSQKVLSLDKSAKRLYGTGSSFENKIGESSSSQIATKIEKTADRGEYSINVIEKASSHKIAGIPLNKNFKIINIEARKKPD